MLPLQTTQDDAAAGGHSRLGSVDQDATEASSKLWREQQQSTALANSRRGYEAGRTRDAARCNRPLDVPATVVGGGSSFFSPSR